MDNEIFLSSADLNIGFFIEKLKELTLLREKIDLFLKMFASFVTNTFISPSARSIINSINKSKGNVRVSELAKDMCYSERQICRLLDSSINLSPKTLCRIVRFQNAIHNIINNPNLDNIHYIFGLAYSDQAHFQREFKEFTGLSPQEFRRSYQREPGVIS
jgi:AraC-like DNA-binding protein